jgi:hypothetical protein
MGQEPEQHVIDNNTKYIIIAGNISKTNKRSMLYAESLAKMYPSINVIFNFGLSEISQQIFDSVENGFEFHINSFKKSPANLHYPKGVCVGNYDFYCTMGWPTIIEENNFDDSYIIKELWKDIDQEFYIDDILMSKNYPRWFTLEDVIEKFNKEKIKVTKWLENDQGKQKVLISALSDWSSSYIGKSTYSTFNGIDLSEIIWICDGDNDFIGSHRNSHVICLPGRDRSRYISEETMNLIS